MIRLNLASGAQLMAGMVNHDPVIDDWHFQDGLPYGDRAIAGVTEAHGLMYLPEPEWEAFFAEVFRVLRPGGVFRVTEDDAVNPESERFGGYAGAVTLTGASMLIAHMDSAGFEAREVGPHESADPELVQVSHGLPPKVVFVEGVKPWTSR